MDAIQALKNAARYPKHIDFLIKQELRAREDYSTPAYELMDRVVMHDLGMASFGPRFENEMFLSGLRDL